MAMMLPLSLPRDLVNMPMRKTPSIGPRIKPAMPSTTGMMRTSGLVTFAKAKNPAIAIISTAKRAVNHRAAAT